MKRSITPNKKSLSQDKKISFESYNTNNALNMNINASKGLSEVLKTNIGPKGTLKMLVGGAGQIKITKDGNVLLHEMQIQHPTASMIGRASTAQDDQVGDGTTSVCVLAADVRVCL